MSKPTRYAYPLICVGLGAVLVWALVELLLDLDASDRDLRFVTILGIGYASLCAFSAFLAVVRGDDLERADGQLRRYEHERRQLQHELRKLQGRIEVETEIASTFLPTELSPEQSALPWKDEPDDVPEWISTGSGPMPELSPEVMEQERAPSFLAKRDRRSERALDAVSDATLWAELTRRFQE